MGLTEANDRLTLVSKALAESPEKGSISVGLAKLQPPDDTIETLVARADAALYKQRRLRRGVEAQN